MRLAPGAKVGTLTLHNQAIFHFTLGLKLVLDTTSPGCTTTVSWVLGPSHCFTLSSHSQCCCYVPPPPRPESLYQAPVIQTPVSQHICLCPHPDSHTIAKASATVPQNSGDVVVPHVPDDRKPAVLQLWVSTHQTWCQEGFLPIDINSSHRKTIEQVDPSSLLLQEPQQPELPLPFTGPLQSRPQKTSAVFTNVYLS